MVKIILLVVIIMLLNARVMADTSDTLLVQDAKELINAYMLKHYSSEPIEYSIEKVYHDNNQADLTFVVTGESNNLFFKFVSYGAKYIHGYDMSERINFDGDQQLEDALLEHNISTPYVILPLSEEKFETQIKKGQMTVYPYVEGENIMELVKKRRVPSPIIILNRNRR